MDKERRRSPRVNKRFMVKYRSPDEGQSEWLMSPIKDLSTVGVRFFADSGYAVGSFMELQLCLPAFKEPVVTRGQVIWQRRPGPTIMTEHGVEFLHLEQADLERISQVTKYFLKKEEDAHGI